MTRNQQSLFCALAMLLPAASAFGQSPPTNDNFDNRTVLSGSSVSFSGSCANSTKESGEPDGPMGSYPTSGTIWWTWTAPVSGPVVITMTRDYSLPFNVEAQFEVFEGPFFGALYRLEYNCFDDPIGRYVKFSAVAGRNYQFRAFGRWPGTLSLQLTASSLPLILRQPTACTVPLFGSATFSVLAAGIPAPAYQWLSNNVPIPGKTGPILIVERLLPNADAIFSVIVSNSAGATSSAPATLTVSNIDPTPSLGALAPTNSSQLPFTLKGEIGRWYSFYITDDLVNWFPWRWGQCTNDATVCTVLRFNQQREFVWASLNDLTDGCVARLRALRTALDFRMIDNKLPAGATYTFADCQPYFPGGILPLCPQNGTYSSGARITNGPYCSLELMAGHTIGN